MMVSQFGWCEVCVRPRAVMCVCEVCVHLRPILFHVFCSPRPQDLLMVVYLSNLTRTQLLLNEKMGLL